jgi:hypothetical protein
MTIKYPVYADYDGSPVVIVDAGFIYGGDGVWHDADAHAVSRAKLFRDKAAFEPAFADLPGTPRR